MISEHFMDLIHFSKRNHLFMKCVGEKKEFFKRALVVYLLTSVYLVQGKNKFQLLSFPD